MGEKDTESQLASFFLYSFLIYPATNYLLSPQRLYNQKRHGGGRWRGILYASLFLALIAGGQMFMDNLESAPTFYQSLRATRHTSPAELKRLYKKRMLETHPDKNKNKSPTATRTVEDFRRAKLAHEVLSNPELRDIYDRLGEQGLRVFAGKEEGQGSAVRGVDVSYVVTQVLMGVASSLALAFVMTLTEPSGEAFSHSVLCLLALLLLDLVYVVGGRPLPAWLLPSWSPHDLLSALHRLFPAAMHACRCICSALHEDPFLYRVEVMDRLGGGGQGGQGTAAVTKAAVQTACAWQDRHRHRHSDRVLSTDPAMHMPPKEEEEEEALASAAVTRGREEGRAGTGVSSSSSSSSAVGQALRELRRKVSTGGSGGDGGSGSARVLELAEQVVALDKNNMNKKMTSKINGSGGGEWEWEDGGAEGGGGLGARRRRRRRGRGGGTGGTGGGTQQEEGVLESLFSLRYLCLYLALQASYTMYYKNTPSA